MRSGCTSVPVSVTTFRHGGKVLNILSIGVVLIGTVLAVLIALDGLVRPHGFDGRALRSDDQHPPHSVRHNRRSNSSDNLRRWPP